MILFAAIVLMLGLTAPASASWDWGRSTPTAASSKSDRPEKIPCDKTQKMCKTGYKAGGLDTYVPNSAYVEDSTPAPSTSVTPAAYLVPAAPATIETAGNGNAMGVLPNYWTLCVANGYGPTVGGPVLSWNYPTLALTISLQNRCDGYSITNRMTIDNLSNAGACIQYSNTRTTAPTKYIHWGPYFYIWNQNPVIWVNTQCNNPGVIEHSACKGVGYILGLVYVSGTPESCMGTDPGWNRATYGDVIDTNQIYQKP
jgi:hypothetical protein